MARAPDGIVNSAAQQIGWDVATGGGSVVDMATAAAVSTGTASKWLRVWRSKLGDDLFRDERQRQRAEQTEAAREQAEQTWSDLRQREARNAGVTASAVRARLLEILPTVATSRVDRGPNGTSAPIVVAGPDARQIKALADTVAALLGSAELLDDRPTRHSRSTSAEAGPAGLGSGIVPSGLLDGLEAGDGDGEVLEAAEQVIRQFSLIKGGDEAGAVAS